MQKRGVEAALQITPLLYEAALQPNRWQAVLSLFAEEFGGELANLNVVRLADMEALVSYYSGGDPAILERHLALRSHRDADPRIPGGLLHPNRPMRCRDLVSSEVWYASPVYRQVFEPAGLDETLGLMLMEEEAGFVTTVGVVRPKGAPSFSPDDVARFQLYVPHFRALTKVVVRLHDTNQVAESLGGVLDAVAMGVVIVDRFGAIVFANAAAREILAGPDAVGVADGLISASARDINQKLTASIFANAAAPLSGGTAEAEQIVVPRDEGPPLWITVTRTDLLSKGKVSPGHALVLLNDPARRHESDAEQLQRLFALTAAEAAVLQRFVDGESLRAIAESTGRSYETIRNQMKQVMAKVGVERQSELMRVVLNAVASRGF